jgi:hypothetical protein
MMLQYRSTAAVSCGARVCLFFEDVKNTLLRAPLEVARANDDSTPCICLHVISQHYDSMVLVLHQ